MDWWAIVFSVAAALVLAWIVLVVALAAGSRDRIRLGAALRLLPDLLRLLARLARDPQVPRWLHVVALAVLAYLASPLDLVPDLIPVIGYLDDVIIVAVVLRWIVSAAGVEAIDRNWPGASAGRDAVLRLIRR